MSKHSNRLLMLALLSAFAATTIGSTVAAEQRGNKDRFKQSQKELQVKIKSGESADEHHDKKRSGRDTDAAPLTVKTSMVTVTNRGAAPLTITAPPAITRVSGKGAFAIVAPGAGTPCATSLVVAPRGGKCTIGVEYTPSDSEESTARLTLTDTGAATATQETLIRAD